ncbi:MAG: extracellular solute-binding protein [Bacilli bacterium]|nr:extracellular solute-binding protein [Bacilli bacterium]
MKSRKNALILALSCFALIGLAGCGGGGDDGPQEPPEPQFEVDEDIEFDEDGRGYFDNVEINLWAVGGDPDASTMDRLIANFNKKYAGEIMVKCTHVNEENYYTQLDTTWRTDPDELPDFLWVHNTKISLYAGKTKQYLLPLTDSLLEQAHSKFDFTTAYENIDRTNILNGTRYGIPIDSHGFLTYIRQDIIKKNELGFDNNTRFIPHSKTEYQGLLKGLKDKAQAGTLLTRTINKGQDHAWRTAGTSFGSSFVQSSDPDGLSALYANGGRLMDEAQERITFQENSGFVNYVVDEVNNFNAGRIIDGTNTALFGTGDTVMFSEGPWWSASNYEPNFNNTELRSANEGLHITQEEANDPVYSRPLTASHPIGWWTNPENEGLETAHSWYGLGHSIALINKSKVKLSMVAAVLEYAKWFALEQTNGEYNLATWATSGHVPAWKEVYESESYKKVEAASATLRGIGNPEDIIGGEPLTYQDTVFNGFQSVILSVQSAMLGDGCTEAKARELINTGAEGLQLAIDQLKFLED